MDHLTALSRDLGRQRYAPVFDAMQRFADARDEATTDEVWSVEHDAVFTQGQAGKAEHVLGAGDIPVVQIDRGGQVTYHGPGQLVVYPLLDLRRLKLGVRDYVDALEETVIRTLARWDIAAVRRPGAPGVYTGDAKIAALGIRVRRGCTLHGLALNVDGDLSPFMRINPCGFAGLRVTSMLESGAFQAGVSRAETGPGAVKPALLSTLGEVLGLALQPAPPPSLDTAPVQAA